MNQIAYKTSRRIEKLVNEKIIEEHKSNGDGAQWKTKIIRSSFIQAVSNTSLTLKKKLSGATLWDDAVSNTSLMQQNKQNKWMNVLQYIYKQNDWTPAQRKVFTSEICHCVDAFDYDLLEGSLSFIDMDVFLILTILLVQMYVLMKTIAMIQMNNNSMLYLHRVNHFVMVGVFINNMLYNLILN